MRWKNKTFLSSWLPTVVSSDAKFRAFPPPQALKYLSSGVKNERKLTNNFTQITNSHGPVQAPHRCPLGLERAAGHHSRRSQAPTARGPELSTHSCPRPRSS